MALRYVNTTPATAEELVFPGTPVGFSLKSDNGFVNPASLNVKLGYTQLMLRSLDASTALLPSEDQSLLKYASLKIDTAERVRPVSNQMSISSAIIDPFTYGIEAIKTGLSGTREAGIHEITTAVEAYSPVLAGVTFYVSPSWIPGDREYWSTSNMAPAYVGLEYGIKNTGLFIGLRDDGTAGGSLVIGGPLQALSTARPGQVEISGVGWKTSSVFTVFVYVDASSNIAYVWKQNLTDTGPVQVGSFFSLDGIGNFQPETGAFTQQRSGPSFTTTLFFGNGSTVATESVIVTDFALYTYFPQAVYGGEARVEHKFTKLPDLPFVFASTDKRLPTESAIGRWATSSSIPTSKFWFQPGQKSNPLYTEITSAVGIPGPSFLRRVEPALGSNSSFSVEAWMAGEAIISTGVDKGFGFRVNDGVHTYAIHAIDAGLVPTYGIQKYVAFNDLTQGFYLAQTDGEYVEANYSGLRLVRLSVDKIRDVVRLYIEDPDIPFLEVPLTESVFPAAISVTGCIDVGIFGTEVVSGTLRLAVLNFMNDYNAWEMADGLPTGAPTTFVLSDIGGGSSSIVSSGALQILKTSYGPSSTNHYYFSKTDAFTYRRGFQVDFRAKVSTYSTSASIQNSPNMWTGAGVTVFLGAFETPDSAGKKVHVGFFDCGPHGKKVAIVPNEGVDDIIQQTIRGQKYSASLQWNEMTTLRLVYRPHKSVELWGQTLIKGVPLISIPWDEFECEEDPANTSASIVFGHSNPNAACESEWEYVRWGVSAGYDYEITQNIKSIEPIQNGRVLIVVDAEDVPAGGNAFSASLSESIISATSLEVPEVGAAPGALTSFTLTGNLPPGSTTSPVSPYWGSVTASGVADPGVTVVVSLTLPGTGSVSFNVSADPSTGAFNGSYDLPHLNDQGTVVGSAHAHNAFGDGPETSTQEVLAGLGVFAFVTNGSVQPSAPPAGPYGGGALGGSTAPPPDSPEDINESTIYNLFDDQSTNPWLWFGGPGLAAATAVHCVSTSNIGSDPNLPFDRNWPITATYGTDWLLMDYDSFMASGKSLREILSDISGGVLGQWPSDTFQFRVTVGGVSRRMAVAWQGALV